MVFDNAEDDAYIFKAIKIEVDRKIIAREKIRNGMQGLNIKNKSNKKF